MEQRPLRLGDIVDDYCPRERRITNHAIVAIVEETVKQTRCATCDHEHVYKHAKEPRRRKKDETSALYSQVLSGLQKPGGQAPHAEVETMDDAVENDEPIAAPAVAVSTEAPVAVAAAAPELLGDAAGPADAEPGGGPAETDALAVEEDNEPWPTHRRLIRAQLPRTGNEPPPARPLPEFTIRQPGARGSQRQWGRGGGNPNGNVGGNGSHGRGGQGQSQGGGRPGRGGRFAPPRPDGPRGGGGRPGGGRGRRSR